MIQNLKIFLSLRVSSPLNLLFMPNLLTFSLLFFHLELCIKLILFLFLQSISPLPCKPSSGQSLYKKCSLIPPFLPHFRIKVHDRLDNLIISGIQENPLFLHLRAHFPLTFRRLTNPLISLSLPGEA